MLDMARKKPDSKRSKGEDRHTKPRIAFHLDQGLLDALERHIKLTRLTTTAVMVLALEEYLTQHKEWPAREA